MSYTDPGIANAIRNRRGTPSQPAPAPNPAAAIITDPGVALANLQRAQAIEQANSQLNTQRSQSLINFGDPSMVKGLGFTVNPNTQAAANQNQYSTVANLKHQQGILHRNLLNGLAGHGLLHSGDLGYGLGEQTRNYGQALYGAQHDLLATLNQYLTQNISTQNQANDNYTQQLLQALSRLNPAGALG